MNRAPTTLTAATVAVGLAAGAPSSAQANPLIIAPAAAAAWIAGGVLTGAFVGAAVANANNGAVVTTPAVAAPAATPGVTINSTTCYFTHAWVHHVWRRVQVCNTY